MNEVLFDAIGDRVARISINRPEARNAMSIAVRRGIAQALQRADADPDISAIILTATGREAFSASLDIKELKNNFENCLLSPTMWQSRRASPLAVRKVRMDQFAAVQLQN